LGVDVDGARVKIEALPNDPDLLNDLTTHKVRRENKGAHNVISLSPSRPVLTLHFSFLMFYTTISDVTSFE
jgi:hypothetical protein